jgi:hypothetical protein
MPGLHKAIQVLGKTLPKVVSPKEHAVGDYGAVALFLLGSALFWRKSKPAAVAALICGFTGASVAALTDYRGEAKHAIRFPLHRKIDFGLSSVAATIPDFLALEDERQKVFFRMQSILIAALTVITEFEPRPTADIASKRQREHIGKTIPPPAAMAVR